MNPYLLIVWMSSCALLWAQDPAVVPVADGKTPPAVEAPAAEEIEEGGTTQVEEGDAEPEKAVPTEARKVYGWKEWITLEGKKPRIKAKLDTGAKTSSIHAEKIKTIEKDGGKWVRFTVVVPDGEGEEGISCEAPFARTARIRNADGVLDERIVVLLKFRIGAEQREAEFSLNDRGDMIHPVLLGRTTINTLGLVDANSIYLAEEDIRN